MQARPFPICATCLITSISNLYSVDSLLFWNQKNKKSSFSFLLRGALLCHESALEMTSLVEDQFFLFPLCCNCVCNTWGPLYRFSVCPEIPYSWLFCVAASPRVLLSYFCWNLILWITVAWVSEWPPRRIPCVLSAKGIVTWNLV